MCVEIFDDLWVVFLEVRIGAKGNTEENHVSRTHNFVKVGRQSFEQCLVEEFVSNSNFLTLVQRLEEVIGAPVFKCLLQCCHLVFTCVLELSEQWLDILTF